MKTGTITISFKHYWHCGTGQAGEGDLDLLPILEECELPFVPGRTLRGRIKQAGREAEVRENSLMRLFGIGDARSLEETGQFEVTSAFMTGELAEANRKHFEISGNPKPEIAALFAEVASTAMEDGVAKDKSLRRVRYVIPMTLTAQFNLKDDSLEDDLRTCAAHLKAIGKGKRDGFGWCHVSIETETMAPIPESPSMVLDLEANATGTVFEVDIELLDQVVLSATSATTGGHRSLDYIPGSALMGVAARTLFDSKGDEAAEMLAQGKISFGNAYPVIEDAVGCPLPLSWHYPKGAEWKSDNGGLSKDIHNLAKASDGLNKHQPVQIRDGYFEAEHGYYIPVPKSYSLKTAVSDQEEDYEAAEESELFGYEAIRAGSRFRTRVEVSEDESGETAKLIHDQFHTKTVRLGRSKGTEYGRASCRVRPAEDSSIEGDPNSLIFLAESDLALVDSNGFPRLQPEPSDFGLAKDWILQESKCFIRTRRYSLWNSKRGGPDMERQVIVKGSVIVFENKQGEEAHQPKTRIGVGQSEGLGRVLVNPSFLMTECPSFREKEPTPSAETPGTEDDYKEPFSQFVTARHNEMQLDIQAASIARTWIQKWKQTRSEILTRPTQWGRLDDAARLSTTVSILKTKLGTVNPDGDNQNTIFGSGRMSEKWKKAKNQDVGSLARAILDSINSEYERNPESDRLILAAFREAVHQMAADARRKKENSK